MSWKEEYFVSSCLPGSRSRGQQFEQGVKFLTVATFYVVNYVVIVTIVSSNY